MCIAVVPFCSLLSILKLLWFENQPSIYVCDVIKQNESELANIDFLDKSL